MAKIKTLKPLISTMKPMLGYSSGSERDRSRYRDKTQSWRAWYKTSRWQKLRLSILQRDLYTCRVTGVLLIGKHPAPNSAVVDHIKPHRGDEALFWDENNLQVVSKEYHDSVKQKEEQASLQHRGVWD